MWAAIPHIFRKGGNLGGKVLVQVACASFLLVLLDWETGWRGWSVSFALPIVFSAGIVGVTVIIVANRTNWARYVMYQALLALLGFVPPILYLIVCGQSALGSVYSGFAGGCEFGYAGGLWRPQYQK